MAASRDCLRRTVRGHQQLNNSNRATQQLRTFLAQKQANDLCIKAFEKQQEGGLLTCRSCRRSTSHEQHWRWMPVSVLLRLYRALRPLEALQQSAGSVSMAV